MPLPKPMSQKRDPFGKLRADYGAPDSYSFQTWATRQDGTIAFSEGYADFRVRPEPSDVMDALAALIPSSHPSR